MALKTYRTQTSALLKKNWIIKKRNPIFTLVEIAFPILLGLLVIYFRQRRDIPVPEDAQISATIANHVSTSGRPPSPCSVTKSQFYVAPDGPELREFIDYFLRQCTGSYPGNITYFDTGEELGSHVDTINAEIMARVRPRSDIDKNLLALIFDKTGPTWEYTFRSFRFPDTTVAISDVTSIRRRASGYQTYANAASSLQVMLDEWIIHKTLGNSTEPKAFGTLFASAFGEFPAEVQQTDPFFQRIFPVALLIAVLTFLWPFVRLIRMIVEEKELKLRVGMQMMGMYDISIWVSWAITYFIIFTIPAVVLTIQFSTKILLYSSQTLIFLFFFLYTMGLLAFGFFLSAFFSTSKTAVLVSMLVHIGSYVVYEILNEDTSPAVKGLSCLLPTTCFCYGWMTFGTLENGFIGLTGETMAISLDNFSFSTYISMQIVNIGLYIFFAWYMAKIVPSEYGTPLPWYFIFQKNYWIRRERPPGENWKELENKENLIDPPLRDETNFQVPDEEIAARDGIKIRRLSKTFTSNKGTVTAVNDLYLDMYKGQVFALLGHNGAGKTTTISMLTGLLGVTSGDAYIFGKSIRTEMEDIHRILGVCPQQNVLFPDLTVREHLEFFAQVKDLPQNVRKSKIDKMLQQIGLAKKSNALSTSLSGGMKRMLSVGIAFIGDPKIVFLDEPTSGMDVNARRGIWEIIQRKAKKRVIVLTTHFMDEADILGDRIGIMSEGKLVCTGTSLFLKARYGVGYTLVISKSAAKNMKTSDLLTVVDRYVTGYDVVNDIGNEVFLRIPFAMAGRFPELFRVFDTQKEELGIENYVISVTTLEEVFLRAGKEKANEGSLIIPETDTAATGKTTIEELVEKSSRMKEESKRDKFHMGIVHIMAILKKNLLQSFRDKSGLFCNIIIPLVALVVGMLSVIASESVVVVPLPLDVEIYPGPVVIPTFQVDATGEAILTTLLNRGGFEGEIVELEATLMKHTWFDPERQKSPPDQVGLDFGNSMYEHWEAGGSISYGAYSVRMVPGKGKNPVAQLTVYTFVNKSAPHALPIFINAMSTALFQEFTGSEEKISVNIVPFLDPASTDDNIAQFLYSFLPLIFAIFPAGFVIPLIKEKKAKSKLQQMISGVNIISYWMGNFLFDFLQILVCSVRVNFLLTTQFPVVITLILIAVSKSYFFTGDDNDFLAVTLLLVLYSFAVIPFVYLMSNFFDNPNSGRNLTILFLILSGGFLATLSMIMNIIDEDTKAINEAISPLYRIFPAYNLAEGIRAMSTNAEPQDNALSSSVAGSAIIALAWTGVLYMFLVFLTTYLAQIPIVEFKYQQFQDMVKKKLRIYVPAVNEPLVEDVDVVAEREKLRSGECEDAFIKIKGLRKVYQSRHPVIAVRDLWLAIPQGQVFGFLGVNGAGKTTSLNVLSGDVPATSGEVTIADLNILHHSTTIRRMIGYCPQFDALFPLLTGREHLTFYARIKGVRAENIAEVVTGILHYLSLDEYGDRPAGTYSGGNKRKLSAAISLIGNPSVVFLDEISTGVDPISRRFMWRFINETKQGRSALLTTHSMEECEALCDRLGIMVDGSLRCVGTPHHIKHRFGKGYQLDVNVTKDQLKELRTFVEKTFEKSQLLERHEGSCKFHLEDNESTPLSMIFEVIEKEKEALGIVEYSVSHTTLEQIFLYFAKKMDQK